MNLTHYLTSDYDNNSDISMLEKQTQSNPNLPATPFGGQSQILDPILLKWVIKSKQS
jgi:hypothetical protein